MISLGRDYINKGLELRNKLGNSVIRCILSIVDYNGDIDAAEKHLREYDSKNVKIKIIE